MRTTLSLDEDVLLAVKERARRENRSMGSLLSELARQALTCPTSGTTAGAAEHFHGFEPLPRRGAPVSNAAVDQLREDEHI